MMKRNIFLLISFILFFVTGASGKSLKIGAVSNEPDKEIATFLPFARYLSNNLDSSNISGSKIIIASTPSDMARLFTEGKVDIYIDSPLSAYSVVEKAGGTFILRRWKKGIAEYNSTIFIRADSDIKTLSDLKGEVLAFEKPHSASGYLLPKLDLMKQEYELNESKPPKQNGEPPINQNKIEYLFSNDDENTFFWVKQGLVKAGAMSTAKFNKINQANKGMMRSLHTSFSIPRHVVVFRQDLDPALVEQIRLVLLQFDNTVKGRKVLKEFEKTAKFDEIPSTFFDLWLSLRPLLEAELAVQ